MGNVVGSNIFNILCVLGISGLVSPVPLLVGDQLAQMDIPVMLAVALLCVPYFLRWRYFEPDRRRAVFSLLRRLYLVSDCPGLAAQLPAATARRHYVWPGASGAAVCHAILVT